MAKQQPKAPADISAWGANPPDWIVALKKGVDERSQSGVGISSKTTISRVLSKKYRGNYSNIEEKVRARLMLARHDCPYQGDIPAASCLNTRQASKDSMAPHVVKCRMERARGCVHGGGNV